MQLPIVLIIDDEETLRKLFARIIELEGYRVYEAPTAKAAWRLLEGVVAQVVITDVRLPDANGVELTTRLKKQFPSIEVIVLTAFGTIEDGVQAIKNGAFDYLTKGDHREKIIPLLARAVDKALLQQKVEQLEQKLTRRFGFDSIIGSSVAIKEAKAFSQRVAITDTTVLLTGESGTGKEVFANAIHYESPRRRRPLIAVNCSAFSRELLESELFGHRAGSFTGAIKDKKGLFEEAHQGTLFLDELGEMSLDLQAKLLRVLETGTFLRVGDTVETRVDVRIVAATNRELKEEVMRGAFRSDLFYRLSVFSIRLPALRERSEDIPLLAEYFVTHFATRINHRVVGMSSAFVSALQRHNWRGNIRELKNVIERAVLLTDEGELSAKMLPPDFLIEEMGERESALKLEHMERQHILRVLHYCGGNKTHAARLLGIGLTTLYQKLKDYHL